MHPQLTTAALAATYRELLRDAERSRSLVAARDAVPCPSAPWSWERVLCWLRDRWRRHLDLASPWGPISASPPSAA